VRQVDHLPRIITRSTVNKKYIYIFVQNCVTLFSSLSLRCARGLPSHEVWNSERHLTHASTEFSQLYSYSLFASYRNPTCNITSWNYWILTKVLQHGLDSPSRDCSRFRFARVIALKNFSASEISGSFDVLTVWRNSVHSIVTVILYTLTF